MPTSADSRVLLNNGTEMTGYPTVGLPNGPTNDPIIADNKLNPQLPARVKVVSLLPNPTNSPTVLRLTWAVDKNITEPLGWSHSAPGGSLPRSYIDSWSSPFVEPGLPAPDSFNVYSVTRDKFSGLPTYSFVANVSGSTFHYDATLPTLPGTYEYTVTGVSTPSGSLVGGEGPFPERNPQYVIPAPTDSVIVTNPGSQTNVIGDTVNLTITASGTASGALHYTATGLPHGLTLNLTSGIITGTPDTPVGTPVTVIVTVTNTVTGATGQQSFAWTINNVPAPAAPGTPTKSSITATGVTLTWTAPGGSPSATGYNVYDTTGGTLTKLTGSPLGSGTLTYNVTNGSANTTHTYAVTALNGTAESTATPNVSVLFLPGVPTGLTNGTPTTTTAALSWTAPTGGAASYDVYDTTSAHPGTKLTSSPVTSTGFTVTNGVTGTTRKYAVVANNATGSSAETSDLSVTFA